METKNISKRITTIGLGNYYSRRLKQNTTMHTVVQALFSAFPRQFKLKGKEEIEKQKRSRKNIKAESLAYLTHLF